MEDFDNAKTRNPKECVVTNLNSYLTYISDIKETIKKEEGAEVSTKYYFFRGQASNEWNVMPGDEYRDLGGRYNTANGATDDFDIDSGLKKVNIGWTSASITTVRGGTLALPSSIDTVELN